MEYKKLDIESIKVGDTVCVPTNITRWYGNIGRYWSVETVKRISPKRQVIVTDKRKYDDVSKIWGTKFFEFNESMVLENNETLVRKECLEVYDKIRENNTRSTIDAIGAVEKPEELLEVLKDLAKRLGVIQ